MDPLPVKEKIETIKIKVADETTVSMKIFSAGPPEGYLAYIVAVLGLIDRKGLWELSTRLIGEMKNANAALAALKRKSIGPKDKSSKKDQQADDEAPVADVVEKNQSLEILKTAKMQYTEAIAATYEVMRNLLAGEPQTQWDRIVQEMHKGDYLPSPNDGPDGIPRLCVSVHRWFT